LKVRQRQKIKAREEKRDQSKRKVRIKQKKGSDIDLDQEVASMYQQAYFLGLQVRYYLGANRVQAEIIIPHFAFSFSNLVFF